MSSFPLFESFAIYMKGDKTCATFASKFTRVKSSHANHYMFAAIAGMHLVSH